jgi:hydrogenase-4 component B
MDSEALVILSFQACLGAYLAGTVLSVAFMRLQKIANFGGFSCAGVGGLAGCIASALALSQATYPSLNVWPGRMPLFTFSVHLDALACFFILVISLLAIAISIYSLGYVPQYYDTKNVGVLGSGFNLLLLSNTLVFCADNAVFFLISWEMMALFTYVLVSFEHEHPRTRQAGILFFIMSHIGTGCLTLGFLLLFKASGNFSFLSFHSLGTDLSPVERNAAFLLFLVGFGVKAGVIPLHIWLPEAHPVAPTNVSALMSGVLIKTGIYGLVRVLFDFLGPPPAWWGVTILLLGSISALLGVLYALVEHDLKRLLAFHSIENIGIILLGLGASLLCLTFNHPLLAALALIAGLYHTINHACFKGLLFLGAGAVLHATRTKNMEELGGLIKRMPWTAFFFLLGSVAIAGLPPLNGFVSEWLTY